jgi:two-component system, sensor histidine kinase PdtaS
MGKHGVFFLWLLFTNCLSASAQDWRRASDSLLQLAATSGADFKKVDLITRASLVTLFHNPDTAMVLADEAIALAEKSGNDTLMAMAYAAKSAVYVIRDENKPVLEYALKGLEISERTPLPPDVLASLYRKTGYVYRNTNDNAKSIEAYKKAIAFSRLSNNLYDVSATLPNLGQLFFKENQYDSALYYHQEGLRIAKEQGYKDFIVRAYINIVNVYKSTRQYSKGLAMAAEMDPWLSDPAVTPIVKGLAYTSTADLVMRSAGTGRLLAKRYLDSMQRLLQALKPGTENVMNYHLNRALYEFSEQHYDSAAAALVRYYDYKNLYDNEILAGHTQELAARFETGKKEQQIQTLDKESRLRKLLLIIALGVAAVFLVLLFAVWRQKQKIKKQENKLAYLMKELHHRVKNNLQIVSSLLSLQSNKVEDEQAQKALQEGQYRIEAMSLIHRKLYQTDIVSKVSIVEFITELAESLMHAYGYNHENFDLEIETEVKELDADVAIPVGLILNEAVTNAFKYAYKNTTRPLLAVSLRKAPLNYVLSVTDNGEGLSAESWKKSASFGKQLMQSLVKQIGGTMQLQGNNGTVFTFTFPIKPETL